MGYSGLDYAASFEADKSKTQKLCDIVAKYYYRDASQEWLASDIGKQSLTYEGILRYTNACRWVVPWVHNHCNLDGAEIIDIGAGTGATMVAFAHLAKWVHGYEIEERSVAAAHERFSVMGTTNVEMTFASPQELLLAIKRDYPTGAKFVLLFAVLEHLTQEERFTYLSTIWNELLVPGGYFIVVDTPNRLAMFDAHTSEMPFFHLLPPQLALRYFTRSRRAAFVEGMQSAVATGDAVGRLHRWGLGASYHDFEVAFGRDLDGLIVANGFEWEMTNWFPPKLDDELMIRYFLDLPVKKDLGFARVVLNLIFQKPAAGTRGSARPCIERSHLELLSRYHRLDPRIVDALS